MLQAITSLQYLLSTTEHWQVYFSAVKMFHSVNLYIIIFLTTKYIVIGFLYLIDVLNKNCVPIFECETLQKRKKVLLLEDFLILFIGLFLMFPVNIWLKSILY